MADMPTRELFNAIAPTYKDDDAVDTFLKLAAQQLAAAAWGRLYVQAVVYLAAHMLTMRDRMLDGGGGSGPVQAVKTGDVSVTYTNSLSQSFDDALLATTPFGVHFLFLRTHVPTTPYVV